MCFFYFRLSSCLDSAFAEFLNKEARWLKLIGADEAQSNLVSAGSPQECRQTALRHVIAYCTPLKVLAFQNQFKKM